MQADAINRNFNYFENYPSIHMYYSTLALLAKCFKYVEQLRI